MEHYAEPFMAALLISLRIAPTFAFAPPFTLLRTPVTIRVLLAIWLALWIVFANPAQTSERLDEAAFINLAFAELLLGMSFAIALQLAFAALLTAGRAIDIQVGFGLAQLADPALRQQLPLVGTLFSYAAAAIFFTTSGPADLVAIWSRSAEAIPLGLFATINPAALAAHAGNVFLVALGIAGLVLLALFLVDLVIAFMSRTLPQMNMLVIGFQLKTIALLVTLPFVFAFSGSLFLRIIRLALEAMPQMI